LRRSPTVYKTNEEVVYQGKKGKASAEILLLSLCIRSKCAIGFILSFGVTFSTWFGEDGWNFFQGLGMGLAVGLMSIVVYPILYFAIGWVQGFIFGLLFNVATRYMGGIKLETE
jgi:hypothetical protein